MRDGSRKLVRDGIPERLAAAGIAFEARYAALDERRDLLRAKLDEEIAELDTASSSEEIAEEVADSIEVLLALAHEHGIDEAAIEATRLAKRADRGKFERGVVLGSIGPDDPSPDRPDPSECCVRGARPEDAPVLAVLAAQLGYPVDADEMALRLASLPASDVVLVAEVRREVVGWVHVSRLDSLVAGPLAQILGLVVRDDLRGHGIGRTLMAAAEQIARGDGLKRVWLRSGLRRASAHGFYVALGYRETKRQVVFVRDLDPA